MTVRRVLPSTGPRGRRGTGRPCAGPDRRPPVTHRRSGWPTWWPGHRSRCAARPSPGPARPPAGPRRRWPRPVAPRTGRSRTPTAGRTPPPGPSRSTPAAAGSPTPAAAAGASSLTDEAEDERQGDADDGQGLGDGEADPRGAHHGAAGLRLAGRALDDRGENQTDTDAGADGSQTVADDAERSDELQRNDHVLLPFTGFPQ